MGCDFRGHAESVRAKAGRMRRFPIQGDLNLGFVGVVAEDFGDGGDLIL